MRTAFLALILAAATAGPVLADGYPFEEKTQQVRQDTLRLRLSSAQIDSLARTGTVTFSDAQLALVRRFYPKAAKVQPVITATFNDSIEGLTVEAPRVFWIVAEELAITLDPQALTDAKLLDSALAENPDSTPYPSDIRIAPDGEIYIAGKQATLRDALEIIEKEAKEPRESGPDHRQVDVCVAPPSRYPAFESPDGPNTPEERNQAVAELFTTMSKYGEAHKVVVSKCW